MTWALRRSSLLEAFDRQDLRITTPANVKKG